MRSGSRQVLAAVGPRDPDLYRLVERAVIEGRALVLAAKRERKYISSYWDWPTLRWLDSGFPSVHVDKMSDVKDYSAAFSPKEGQLAGPVIYSDLPAFQELLAYGRANDR